MDENRCVINVSLQESRREIIGYFIGEEYTLDPSENRSRDEIIALMDYQVIEKIIQPTGGLSRVEAVRAYCREDQDFWDVLGDYLYLDKGEIAKEKRMQRMAS